MKEFVHEQHANDFAEKYRRVRDEYQDLCDVIRQLLRSILAHAQYSIHSIDCRAKDVESFRLKAGQPNPSDRDLPKYDSPLEQIKDLAAVRIITYVTGAIPAVVQAINANFDVIEADDKSVNLVREGKLGYQSVHLLVRFKEPRLDLMEYSRFKARICEIQVRTILQHTWAQLEHDIRYKSVREAPKEISRRFIALAGLIEIADREFQAIQDEDRRLREELRSATDPKAEPTPDAPIDLPEVQNDSGDLSVDALDADLSPKELVLLGRYSEAVRKYSDRLAKQPNTYTLYIGRARARFLNDDRAGALEDLKAAESLDAPVATVRRLREQIELGIVVPSGSPNASALASRGHAALEKGDGETALEFYQQAGSLGFEPIYCAIDQAMALVLLNRLREAQVILMSIRPHDGSFVEANVFALRLIVQRLAGKEVRLAYLSDMLRGLGFVLAQSPLRYLRSGLKHSAADKLQAVADIFATLEQTAAT